MKLITIFVVALLSQTIIGNAAACTPNHDQLVKNLQKNFQETRKFMGITNDNKSLFEIFIAPNGATFSIIVTGKTPTTNIPITCIIGSGKDWMEAPTTKSELDTDS